MATVTWAWTVAKYEQDGAGEFWRYAVNWSTGVLPGPGDDVVIPVDTECDVEPPDAINIKSVDVAGALGINGGQFATALGVTIEASGGLEIDDPGPLGGNTAPATVTVGGDFTNNGGFANGETATLQIAGAFVNTSTGGGDLHGTVTVDNMTNAGGSASRQFGVDVTYGSSGGKLTVATNFTNTGEFWVGNTAAKSTQTMKVDDTLDNELTGKITIFNATVTADDVDNAGVVAGNTKAGFYIDWTTDAGSSLTVTDTFTNTGDMGIGSTGSVTTVNLGTLDSKSGGIDIVNGAVTVATLTNSGVGDIGVDYKSGESGSANLHVTGAFTNQGGIGIGNSGSTPTVAIDGKLDNQGGIDIASGTVTAASVTNEGVAPEGVGVDYESSESENAKLEVSGAFTNTGELAIGNGASAPTVTIDTLDNQATGGIALASGALTVTALTNEGNRTSSTFGGIDLGFDATGSANAALNVLGSFTNTGGVAIDDSASTPTFSVFATLDNQSTGAINLDSGTLAVGTLTNEGVTAGATVAGIGVDFDSADAGKGNLTVGANFTNAGDFSVGNDATAPTVNIADTLDNQATGVVDLSSGTLTVGTLTNEGNANASPHAGIGVDGLASDAGSGDLEVSANFTNSGEFTLGNGANAPTANIGGELANRGTVNVDSGALDVKVAFINGVEPATDFNVGESNGTVAPTVTIATLANEPYALTNIQSGSVTVNTLTNGALTSAAVLCGVDVGAFLDDTSGGALTVKGAFTNAGTVQIGNGASTPTVSVGTINNQSGSGNVGSIADISLESGTLTVGTLNNNGPADIDVDDQSGSKGSGDFTVTGVFTNGGIFQSGNGVTAPTVSIGTLNNQKSLSALSGSFDVTGTFTNSGKFDADGAEVTIGTLDNEGYSTVQGKMTVNGAVTNNVSGPLVNPQIGIYIYGGGVLKIDGALTGDAPINLADNGSLEIGTTATGGGSITFSPGTKSQLLMDGAVAPEDPISGFSAGDTIDLAGLDYQSGAYAALATSVAGTGATIEVDAAGGETLATLDLTSDLSGVLPTLTRDGGGGTIVSLISDSAVTASSGDKLVTVSGQPYSAYEQLFDQGTYVGTDYFFTKPPAGAAYSSYAYDYSAGNEYIGSSFQYANVADEPYASADYTYDGEGRLDGADFSGVASAAYSSYDYDYVGGIFAGSRFTVTSVPSGASYSSYELDYNQAAAFASEKFFFTNVTSQSYTGEEEDFDASGKLSRVLITGVKGQAYSSLEEDYNAGTYAGYKAYYTGITGQSYKDQEIDVSATNQIEKAVYTAMKGVPYSSVEQDYSGGAVADTIYGFTNVTGASYYSYQVEESAKGALIETTYDLNNGGHVIVGAQNGLTIANLGDDAMTGGGSGETFLFNPIFGADTIKDFAAHDSGAGHDVISLSTSDFANFAAVLKDAAASGAGDVNTTITSTTTHDALTLNGVTTSQLSGLSGDFTFQA